MAISKSDLQKLLQAGYKVADLTQIARSDPAQLQFLVDRANGRNPGLLPKPQFSRSLTTPLPQTPANSASLGDVFRSNPLVQVIGNIAGNSNLRNAVATKIVKPAINVAQGVIGRSANGVAQGAMGKPGPAYAGGDTGFSDDGGFQDTSLPAFNAPELTYRDFSGQARDLVGGVYRPRYAAIDQAAQNAQGQYKRSDAITSGLYQNLAKNIADISARSAAQYKDAQATQAANTQNLVNQQGQNYSSAQNQEAQLLQQLGQGEAAKQVLGDNTAEQAYQQGQSQATGAAQSAALTQQDLTAQDYYRNMDNANQTAGVSARQNLIAQLGDVLQGYDRDRMNLQGDEAQATLQLGQQLSDRDFAAQQANYGIYRDQYSSQVDAQKLAYERAMQQQQAAMQQAEIQRDQSNKDRQFQFDQQKYGTDLATALAQQRLAEQKLNGQQAGAGGLDFANQDPVSKTIQQTASAAGGDTQKAQAYYDFVRSAVSSFSANGIDAGALAGNQFSFIQAIRNEANRRGMDPLVAQAAAAAYWQNIFGKKQ